MKDIFDSLFRSDYMPHGHCYMWKPEILWLNVVSDVLIAFAYFSIPVAIYYFVKKRNDLEFKGIFILFSLFILCCGITHLVSIFVIWHGTYGIHGLSKLLTAIVSCITAYKVYQSMPMALKLPSEQDLKVAYEVAHQEKLERVRIESQRQQEAMLRESTESSHVGILVVDKEGKIQVANDAAVNIFEYTKEELEGNNIDVLVPTKQRNSHHNLVKSFFNTKQSEMLMASDRTVTGVTKSGRIIPIEVRLNRRDHAGKPLVFASFQDISERILAQQAFLSSENMTRSILESLPIGLHIFTLKNDELYLTQFNPAAEKILGFEHQALEGKTIEQCFPDVVGTNIPTVYKRIAREGGHWKDESIAYNDGKVAGIFEVTCFQSNPNTAIVLFENVTKSRAAQQAIREKDDFIHAAFNASVTGVYIYNLQTELIEYVNHSYTAISGYTLDEINRYCESGDFLSLVHEQDHQVLKEHSERIESAIDPQLVFQVEFRFKHKDGHWIWFLSQDVQFSRDDNGTVTKVMGSFLDITELKHMQLNLEELKNTAEQASQAKSEFLANMSHEIRTPMNAILGLTHLVLDMELGDKQYEYLSKVEDSSKSLLNVLNDILDYSKMEAGKLSIENEPFDIEQLIENSVGLFVLLAEEKSIELVIELQPDIKKMYVGDQLRLSQVLNNLIGNALKFTETGHIKLSVNTSAHNKGLVFAVADSGIGMSEEQCKKLFESFTQADSSILRRYGGSGLGLSICKSLAELMNGNISITSQLGEGSTFSLSVPIQPAKKLQMVDSTTLQPMRTLIVDDNQLSCAALSHLVKSWGFAVDTCTSGSNGVQLMNQSIQLSMPYELVIVDWKMPQLDGLEFIRIIQKQAELKQGSEAKVVLMKNGEEHEYLQRFISDQHIDAFIDKPILNSKLRRLIAHLQNEQLPNINIQAQKPKLDIPNFTGKRILLVEDNATNQLVATEFLKKFCIDIEVANNGKQAIELVEKESFDLILMDLQMPIMDGYSTTKVIRGLNKGATIPIVAMSAAVMKSDIEKVKNSGMNGHIAKPIDIEKLGKTLSVWLGETKPDKDSLSKVKTIPADIICPESFEIKNALQRLDNDPNLYQKVLVSFYCEFEFFPEKLKSLSESNDKVTLQRVVHSLKGLSRAVGAIQLFSLAEKVEKQLTQNDYSVKVEELADLLQADLRRIKKVLPTKELPKVNSVNNTSSIVMQLKKSDLIEKLKSRKFMSLDDLSPYMESLAIYLSQHELDALTKAVAELDYSLAIKIVTQKL
ncbi:PAS domain S-box protein [Paraglaciecola aquimarina]|uniref:histidine kinase n=1 Tax=Paraglaciecola algarum TaxID=3050085 RepID=A0ABS9D743_9ALTE|nr:PAS domain S-box protein [Paraglaciecola sp. G1-23]MCF2948696.1 PAS domain S-box protein [Paraglaciecola sp. G1-23]